MALETTGIDFSQEDWDTPVEFFDGCWVIANRHCPGLNHAMELNNRTFVFRLREKSSGREVLVVFGHADGRAIDAVKALETQTGLEAAWIIGNGGGHHLFLDLWYEAFPKARILVPAMRIPHTANGKALSQKYPDRWELMHGPRPKVLDEFGDQIDLAIFDQLHQYKDETSIAGGSAKDHASPPSNVGGFSLLKRMGPMMKDMSQRNDEVFLFHRAAGLAIAGHNFQLSFIPKGYKPAPRFKMKAGGFPMNLMMSMMMPKGGFKSTLEMMPSPIADPAVHAATWERVLDWDFRAWTSAHDPPGVCGPDLERAELKEQIRASLGRSGELDPTGASLKWNRKHGTA